MQFLFQLECLDEDHAGFEKLSGAVAVNSVEHDDIMIGTIKLDRDRRSSLAVSYLHGIGKLLTLQEVVKVEAVTFGEVGDVINCVDVFLSPAVGIPACAARTFIVRAAARKEKGPDGSGPWTMRLLY